MFVEGFAVQPDGRVVERLTVPVNPLREFMFMVVEVWVPANVVSEFGVAETLKSGEGGAAKLVVSGLPTPVAKS
jgi:hypothetical protein